MEKKKKKRRLVLIICIILAVILLTAPLLVSLAVYQENFGKRFDTYAPIGWSIDEFEGLKAQKYTFVSDKNQELVGYKYYKDDLSAKGLVVIVHGFGGGGHNTYMEVADYLTSHGYLVFAYDATGNDESGGEAVYGFPQGVIDLDYALDFVEKQEEFAGLPIMLFGHSWGAFSSGSVLKIHPEIKAVVMAAAFNTSLDMIESEGRQIVGDGMSIMMPYMSLIEWSRFGKYASSSCLNGFAQSTAGIMLIHSEDDPVVPIAQSFDVFYEKYHDDPRFAFIRYEDREHDYVYHSDAARAYIDIFNEQILEYADSLGEGEITPQLKADFINENLDKKVMYQLDQELFEKIIAFYDSYVD